jgi:hypothetical protein
MDRRICTYWQGDPTTISEFLGGWRAKGLDVTVFDESHVSNLLRDIDPNWQALFDRIRLPACRSDMARLVLVHCYGGMYIDCHGSPEDRSALDGLFAALETHDLVMFLNGDDLALGKLHIFNGTILARRSCDMLRVAMQAGFNNLLMHYHLEAATTGHIRYNIAELTGGWMLGTQLLDLKRPPFEPLARFSGRIHRVLLPAKGGHAAFRWYSYYAYRTPGQHWSERQATERLFDIAAPEDALLTT